MTDVAKTDIAATDLASPDASVTNTARSFDDKWKNNPALAFDETLRAGSDIQQWILNRNGFAAPADLTQFLSSRTRVLDAGCGNGRVTALLQQHAPASTEIVGIDLVSADVARGNLAPLPNVRIESADLLAPLDSLGTFDFVYCQEVLHHTANPRAAFLNLAGRVAPGGDIAIYVYKVKAPVREFVDDYVRDRIAGLDYEAARAVCAEITELGRVLSEVEVNGVPLRIQVPAVGVLGIEAGEYELQRFVYHFFMKCFWNPALSEDANIALNYDWYHPQEATRHELGEVLGWFGEAGLAVQHSHVDPYGITVRGTRAA